MSNNEKLQGLAIYDFSRLHSIDKRSTAPNLTYFAIGDEVLNISRFKMEDLALLVTSMPELKGLAVKPYRESGISKAGKTTTYYLLCKGKRKLEKDKDDIKLEKICA